MADMDQQPHENLSGNPARQKTHDIGKDMRICMFATDVTQFLGDVRPMAIQQTVVAGHLPADAPRRRQTISQSA